MWSESASVSTVNLAKEIYYSVRDIEFFLVVTFGMLVVVCGLTEFCISVLSCHRSEWMSRVSEWVCLWMTARSRTIKRRLTLVSLRRTKVISCWQRWVSHCLSVLSVHHYWMLLFTCSVSCTTGFLPIGPEKFWEIADFSNSEIELHLVHNFFYFKVVVWSGGMCYIRVKMFHKLTYRSATM